MSSLPIAQSEITQQLPIKLVHDVVSYHSALVVALVDDRTILLLLRVIVTCEGAVSAAAGIGKPYIREASTRQLINPSAIRLNPRACPQP